MADDKLSANDRKSAEGGGAEGPSPASFAGAGVQFVVAILLFLYVGKWLDEKLGTAPWLLIAGVFVGAAAGFYSFYTKITAASRGHGGK
jgi:F0F1-type ATP synthase assembly protein I